MSSAVLPRHAASPRPALAIGTPARALVSCLAPPALLAVLVAGREAWAVRALLVVALLVVPGVLLLRLLRVPAAVMTRNPVYVPAASLLVLSASSLALDLLMPLWTTAPPLRTGPVLVGLLIACLAMSTAGAVGSVSRAVWPTVGLGWADLGAVVLPILAVVGVERLNAGRSPVVAVVAVVAAAVVLVALFVLAGRLSPRTTMIYLFSATLALLWGFSLRGSASVYGYDIASELHIFQTTVAAGVWHPVHHDDAYGAMLSVTVLPTAVHALTDLSPLLIFKAVYPALFALVPCGVYAVARSRLNPRWAVAAPLLLLAQGALVTQLPQLARQEIGLLAFTVLVCCLLERGLARSSRLLLLGVGAVLLAVAHYTTTYLTVATLGITVVLQLVASAVRRRWVVGGALAAALLLTAGCAALWDGAVTRSASNVGSFVSSVSDHGLDLLPSSSGASNPVSAYLNGNTTTSAGPAAYQQLVTTQYATDPYIHPVPDWDQPQYDLAAATPAAAPSRHPGAASVVSHVDQVGVLLLEAIAGVAALVLVLRRRSARGLRVVGVLATSALLGLVVVRLSGTVAESYNASRAFVQALLVLSVAGAWLLGVIAFQRRALHRVVATASAVFVAVGFVYTLGISPVALGGARPASLSATGEDVDRFVPTAAELAGARWLNAVAPSGQLVNTDRYGALRFLIVSGRTQAVISDVAPRAVDAGSWVYGDEANVVAGRARGQIGSTSALFAFPRPFLDQNFDVVYTDGSTEVWHR